MKMEEWKEYQLGDVCSRLSSGKNISASKISGSDVYPVFGGNGLRGYTDNSNFTGECAIIGRQGAFCGNVRFFSGEAYMTEHAVVVCGNEKANTRYLSYLLSTMNLGRLSGQSAQPGLAVGTLAKQLIKLPPLPTQQKIAAILSSLDDKIELNNKINTNLEQQAQALFKTWFVDFEPFGGKMPEGWKVGKLGDIVEETLNGDWGKDEPMGTNTEFVYCIRGADIPDVKVGNKGKMPKRYILPKNFESKHLVDGDLVIEISGGSPTQSTGRIAYISQALLSRYEGKMVCTNFCKALKPKQDYQMFMYYYWQYLYERNVFFSYENGTTGIKNLDINGILENEEIAIPTIESLSDFNNFCNSVFLTIFSNGAQSEQLTNIRDSILPKLMNDEIETEKLF